MSPSVYIRSVPYKQADFPTTESSEPVVLTVTPSSPTFNRRRRGSSVGDEDDAENTDSKPVGSSSDFASYAGADGSTEIVDSAGDIIGSHRDVESPVNTPGDSQSAYTDSSDIKAAQEKLAAWKDLARRIRGKGALVIATAADRLVFSVLNAEFNI
jgi:hypothetical protein